ncbi:hypothetical protein [Hirschia litorea]|uniref:5-carboxymethyl-2-hydroxymuconate isomerase n=1 Tax=Hirschia litorea TaxID=1199156 RepID=A0ABW2IKH9_9PROT
MEYSCDVFEEKDEVECFLDLLVEASARANAIIPTNLKLRAMPYNHFRVSGGSEPFVHINVALMEGPSEKDLEQLADLLFSAVSRHFAEVKQVTLDVRTTNPKTYRKR